MKKYIYLFIMFCLVLLPTNIYAKNKYMEIGDNLKLDENINNSFVAFGENVDINNQVDGIYLTFAQDIKYNANNDYVILFSQNIDLTGSIKDAVIFSQNIDIKNANIKRDIVLFGESVDLSGDFYGNVVIFSDSVDIKDARFHSNVYTYSSSLDIDENSSILGTLHYNKNTDVSIKSNNINDTKIKEKVVTERDVTSIIVDTIISLLSILALFLVMYFVKPKLFDNLNLEHSKNILYGLGWLMFAPVIAFILLLSSVGIKISVVVALIYVISIMLSSILTGFILGTIICEKYIPNLSDKKYLVGVIGISIIFVLKFIPILGGLISFFSLIYGLGVFVNLIIDKK